MNTSLLLVYIYIYIVNKNSQHFVTLKPNLYEYFLGEKYERMKIMQFIKQVEATYNPIAHQLTSSPDSISCCFQLLLFILRTGWTHHAPYCLGAILPQCSTTQHILVFSRDLFLAICYLSECLLNNVVCLPLVTNARINLWSHAGRRNGLQSATTNKFLITDPAICLNYHMPHSHRNRFQPGHIQCAANIY